MFTRIQYSDGFNYSEPKVKAEIKIEVDSEKGLDSKDYLALVSAVTKVKTILKKYKKEQK